MCFNQRHATLGAGSGTCLAYFAMHWARPIGHLLLFFWTRLLLWRLASRHMHRESSGSRHVHIAFHAPHHLTARIYHHHDHEEHHGEHTAHVHHHLNGSQQVGV